MDSWPHKVQPGRAVVTVYRRKTPGGGNSYMVANYLDAAKRRFDCYPTETEALEAAKTLAERLDKRVYVAASMKAIEYVSTVQSLQPFRLTLCPAVATLTEAVKLVGDLPSVLAAAKLYTVRHKRTVAKRVGRG